MMSIAYGYSRDGSSATPAAKPKPLLIDGRRVPSASGRTFESLNPATEQVIASIAEGNEIDVDRAVAAARRAFEGPWRTMRAAERGHILLKWAELLKKHVDEIAELESLDAGKPIAAVLRQDFPAAIDTLIYYAGWADKISGEVVSTRDDALTYTVREPVGVVAAIVPWNFPLMIGMWKLAPALACGCTIVMKPAELTSLSALRIGELALEAGLPPGVLNIVTGPGRVSSVPSPCTATVADRYTVLLRSPLRKTVCSLVVSVVPNLAVILIPEVLGTDSTDLLDICGRRMAARRQSPASRRIVVALHHEEPKVRALSYAFAYSLDRPVREIVVNSRLVALPDMCFSGRSTCTVTALIRHIDGNLKHPHTNATRAYHQNEHTPEPRIVNR